jgi:hypothetical protein
LRSPAPKIEYVEVTRPAVIPPDAVAAATAEDDAPQAAGIGAAYLARAAAALPAVASSATTSSAPYGALRQDVLLRGLDALPPPRGVAASKWPTPAVAGLLRPGAMGGG